MEKELKSIQFQLSNLRAPTWIANFHILRTDEEFKVWNLYMLKFLMYKAKKKELEDRIKTLSDRIEFCKLFL